jgi:hypothetical protein
VVSAFDLTVLMFGLNFSNVVYKVNTLVVLFGRSMFRFSLSPRIPKTFRIDPCCRPYPADYVEFFNMDSANPRDEAVSRLVHVLSVIGEFFQETLFY